MGEEAWADFQKQRKNAKAELWRSKNVDKVTKWRRDNKRALIDYKGGACERCGLVSEINGVYDFHHKNPAEKDFAISKKGNTRSYEKCIAEVDKCMLVCKNCHAIIHHELILACTLMVGEQAVNLP